MRLRDLTQPLFEEIDPETLAYWVKYAGHRDWRSEDEARSFIANKATNAAWTINMSPEQAQAHFQKLAAEMPVYQTKKGWRIGDPRVMKNIQRKRSRQNNPPFSWKNITLLEPNFTELRSFGFLDLSDLITGPKMVSVASLTPTESGQDEDTISQIIQWIKEDGEFKPLVIEEDGAIVDGHHRLEALKLMKVKRVPVYTIVRGS